MLTKGAFPGPALQLAAIVLLTAGTALTYGCGPATTTVAFTCGPEINGGTLLTVDAVRTSESEVERIRALGEKWFYDPLRESLRDRTRTATFSQDEGRCDKELKFTAGKEDKYLVLIADYRFQTADPGRYLVALPKDKWKGKTIHVQIRDRDFTIVQP
ncbi:MAG: hypothetical protein ACM3JH_03210 [Acidithiobacillales bacterium]